MIQLRLLATRWAALADEARAGRHSHPRAPPSGRAVAAQVLGLEGVGLSDWPPAMQAAYGVQDAAVLRDVKAASAGLYVARSSLAGGTSGLGVFAARRISEGDVVGPYFGAIVYTDLGAKRIKTARYASSVLGSHAPTSDDFFERALQVRVRPPVPTAATVGSEASAAAGAAGHPPSGRARARTRVGSDGLVDVWIVASPACVAGYVNDCRPTGLVDQASHDAARAAQRAADVGACPASPAGGVEAAPRSRDSPHTLHESTAASIAGPNVKLHVRSGPSASQHALEELSVEHLIRPDAVVLVALRAIAIDEELVLDYGGAFLFERGDGGDRSGRQLTSRSTPHTFTAVGE